MRYLLDTCVVSELVQKAPEPNVVKYMRLLDEDKLYLSVITIGEIKQGIELLKDGRKKKKLTEWLADDLQIRFRGRIISINESTMYCWASLMAKLTKIGKPMPVMDSLIAATCLSNNLTLISRNEKDYASTNVQMINPWKRT